MEESPIEWTPKARQILGAASRLFYAHGIHAVGVEAIASEAGVTKKTIYDRFGSKERLVVEYLRDRDRRWCEFLNEHLAVAGEDAPARLRAVFDASAAWMEANSGKGCSMVNAHAEISDPTHPAYVVIAGQKAWMLNLFAQITGRAGVADPDLTAEMIMIVHEGALVADGMDIVPHAIATARDATLALLRARH